MKLEYHQLSAQNIEQAVNLLYNSFARNGWLDLSYTEEEIKEQIHDSLDDEEAFEFSTLVVDIDYNNSNSQYNNIGNNNSGLPMVVGVHLAMPLNNYLKQIQNWEFHAHFAEMEEYFNTVSQKQRGTDNVNKTIWSYWVSNVLSSKKIPIQLAEILSEKIRNGDQHYEAIVSFISHRKMRHLTKYGSQNLSSINIVDLISQKAVQQFLGVTQNNNNNDKKQIKNKQSEQEQEQKQINQNQQQEQEQYQQLNSQQQQNSNKQQQQNFVNNNKDLKTHQEEQKILDEIQEKLKQVEFQEKRDEDLQNQENSNNEDDFLDSDLNNKNKQNVFKQVYQRWSSLNSTQNHFVTIQPKL